MKALCFIVGSVVMVIGLIMIAYVLEGDFVSAGIGLLIAVIGLLGVIYGKSEGSSDNTGSTSSA